jgi:beta-galactosidase
MNHCRFLRIIVAMLMTSVCAILMADEMAVQSASKDASGVTLTLESGTLRLDVCGDRTIHVMGSATDLGETGIGHAVLDNEPSANSLPWYNAFCGDVDICGFKKPQLYYREVIWGNAKVNLAVHAPIPAGRRERVSAWGWPDERQSWTWPGSEGKPLDVTVYSSCPSVRLELDGKEIATQPVNDKMIARFKVTYQPGELRAVALSEGKPVASAGLRTAGEPKAIRLTADRSTIRADRNDLSYVTVEIVDRRGTVVPNGAIPVHFTVTGAGELAATGSPAPNDASSFHLPVRKTYQGRCLAILRPRGDSGRITLKAEADGLKAATIIVKNVN